MAATPPPTSLGPILIHIGYPKTGSTWAQKVFFTSGDCGFWNVFPSKPEMEQIGAVLIAPSAYTFDPSAARSFFERRLAPRHNQRLIPVISSEGLAGRPYAPSQLDGKIIAERIRDVFGSEGRILVVIREQKSMILSRYSQFIRAGGWKRIEQYVDAFGPEEYPRWNFMYRDYLLYDRLIAHYQALFGKGSVLALPFEMLRTNPSDFAGRIAAFAGVTFNGEPPSFDVVKQRISAASLRLRRILNPFITENRGNPFGVLMPQPVYRAYARLHYRIDDALLRRFAAGFERRLRASIVRLAGDHYRASNRRTAEITGIDLAKFGYDV